MSKANGNSKNSSPNPRTISTISVAGFKSILDEQTFTVRPLTLLAGANSSGKSSMMQPLLLLKQSLEAQYDPGPLLLNGPNAKFTSVNQFWPVRSNRGKPGTFVITVGLSDGTTIGVAFRRDEKLKPLRILYTSYGCRGIELKLSEDEPPTDAIVREKLKQFGQGASRFEYFRLTKKFHSRVSRTRSFLELVASREGSAASEEFPAMSVFSPRSGVFKDVVSRVMEVVHLPGLRGNPERTYPVTAVGNTFPGTFESYVASLIVHWNSESPEYVKDLGDDLRLLGLTWKVEAKRVADTHVEIRVGRMPRSGSAGGRDLVSLADVGFGVSQTLPVVVALRAARPGQLLYVEQPEIHLHPRAQVAMAHLLVNAANRGVRVVAETHSSLVLLAVQTLVAEGAIDPDLIGLNWFIREEKTGTTRIEGADLDAAGRFGDWPEDFDEVALKTESDYLAAAESRIARS
jgi:AAA domain, putative AbiEii toxin, Type IV TA system